MCVGAKKEGEPGEREKGKMEGRKIKKKEQKRKQGHNIGFSFMLRCSTKKQFLICWTIIAGVIIIVSMFSQAANQNRLFFMALIFTATYYYPQNTM